MLGRTCSPAGGGNEQATGSSRGKDRHRATCPMRENRTCYTEDGHMNQPWKGSRGVIRENFLEEVIGEQSVENLERKKDAPGNRNRSAGA